MHLLSNADAALKVRCVHTGVQKAQRRRQMGRVDLLIMHRQQGTQAQQPPPLRMGLAMGRASLGRQHSPLQIRVRQRPRSGLQQCSRAAGYRSGAASTPCQSVRLHRVMCTILLSGRQRGRHRAVYSRRPNQLRGPPQRACPRTGARALTQQGCATWTCSSSWGRAPCRAWLQA